MLKKYQNFYKISKTQQCTFYEANLRQDMKKVLIKRIKSKWSWNEMLKSKSLKIQSASSYFPKVLQIFKHNGSYFVVYEIPYGPALQFATSNIKLDIREFYQTFNSILNFIIDLKKEVSNMYIYPQWMFLHRNMVKIAHFEPYFQQGDEKQKKQGHVFMYDLLRGSFKSSELNQTNEGRRIKNVNFNLGYIAYHLLTGENVRWQEDEKDYNEKMILIQKSAKMKILDETNDQILAELIHDLLSFTNDPNDFDLNENENQVFQKFRTYITKKVIDCKACSKKKQNFRIVEFSLEKIKLQNKMPKISTEKQKKCYRACCFKKNQKELNPSDQYSNKFKVVERYGQNQKQMNEGVIRIKTQNLSNQSQKRIKQNTQSTMKFTKKHKINSSCVLPQLSTERKDKKLLQRMRVHQNRSTMFRKSLHSSGLGTIKTYLRTEYD